jgi:hypothetical protein
MQLNVHQVVRDLALGDEDVESYVPMCSHAGFLSSAEALSLHISNAIYEHVTRGDVKHVVFAGHSAGGAVASLLFAHFLSQAAKDR